MYFSMSAAPWPNLFVTILTSSGGGTSLGMSRASISAGIGLNLSTIAVENARNAIRCQLVMEVVVHLDGRRPAAGANAFHLFERENAVRSHALMPHAQLLLESLVEVVGAAQHATDIGADLDVVLARRLEAQHGVVAGHVAYFEFGQAQSVGDLRHHSF